MKWAGYAWAVIVGLITVVVVLAVLLKFSAPFERVVVSLLALIYIAVESYGVSNAFIVIENSRLDRVRFLTLLKAAGSQEYETETVKEQIDYEEKMQQMTVKLYIKSCFTFVNFIAAILSLVGVVSN